MGSDDMKLDDFRYDLPPELIAQRPLEDRSSSRLLAARVFDHGLRDMFFRQLPEILHSGDLLVLNDTRVFRARLKGRKAATGGMVEVFLLKRFEDDLWKAMVRPGRSAKAGAVFDFGGRLSCTVEERLEHGRAMVRFSAGGNLSETLEAEARVPLPPYIRREPEELDRHRYQTVFASAKGAVAAPTAGLHFTRELLDRLAEGGVDRTFVTLHVGPGTFQPLRFAEISRNRLEPEEYYVPAASLESIRSARSRGGRIVAVGTTTTRILETVDLDSTGPLSGETDMFIFPPYSFRNVDVLITNFHLPESSLLCLVAAFMGYDFMMRAYTHAVENSYRFYSYGDAMIIEKEPAG